MVSTRGLKFKFSEGERVLCYEPDPTKAKVLYDSKVLEVKVNKDHRGRKGVEFLIHFQGWNSSWDRCVTEDYILKDTEENRQLQKDLAHKAQLQLRGAYLYRRDRTKRRRKPGERGDCPERHKVRRRTSTSVSTTSTSNTSESNLGGSDHENSSSSQDEDESRWNENDSDNSSNVDVKEEEEETEHREEKIVLELSETLRKALERDSHFITKQNKVVKLPAVPDVVTILEDFVKQYANTQLTASTGGSRNGHSHRYSYKYLQHYNKGRDLAGICRNLNICKEVADGLRIYFDFTLKPLLLYEQEMAQAQRAISLSPIITPANIKVEAGLCDDVVIKIEDDVLVKQEREDDDCGSGPSSKHPVTSDDANFNPDPEAARRRSLRSHKPADATSTAQTAPPAPQALQAAQASQASQASQAPQAPQAPPATNGVALTESAPGNSHSQFSSVTSTSSRCSTISPAPIPSSSAKGEHSNDALGSPRSKAILTQVASWHLIPQEMYEQVPAPPSLIYGAVHLTRLFVRLPDLLSASAIPSKKLKVLQTHLENFLGFVEDHPDWFSDDQYVDADCVSS